jgi:hypothetical protein
MGKEFLVHGEETSLDGQNCRIDVYYRGERGYYSITRFNEHDAFICDGFSVEEVLTKHRGVMPLAISCRPSLRREEVNHALAA